MSIGSLTLTREDANALTSAFEEMYRRNFRFVWRVLRHSRVADADLDDAAQEVFLVALRKWNSLDTAKEIRPWLLRVARHVAARKQRSVRRAKAREEKASAPHPPEGPDVSTAQREAAQQLQDFLATLPEPQRDIFVAVDIAGMTVPQACDGLGVRLNTAYSRLRSARIAFRALVARIDRGEDCSQ